MCFNGLSFVSVVGARDTEDFVNWKWGLCVLMAFHLCQW